MLFVIAFLCTQDYIHHVISKKRVIPHLKVYSDQKMGVNAAAVAHVGHDAGGADLSAP